MSQVNRDSCAVPFFKYAALPALSITATALGALAMGFGTTQVQKIGRMVTLGAVVALPLSALPAVMCGQLAKPWSERV